MRGSKGRRYTREFKLAAVNRMLAGVNVSALARELGLRRKRLYQWCAAFRARGPDGLRGRGRPRKADPPPPAVPAEAAASPAAELTQAQRRVAELERKVGQQALELDFFTQALRHVEASRRPSDRPGATASTPRSRRRRNRKAG
jgi:transposase